MSLVIEIMLYALGLNRHHKHSFCSFSLSKLAKWKWNTLDAAAVRL